MRTSCCSKSFSRWRARSGVTKKSSSKIWRTGAPRPISSIVAPDATKIVAAADGLRYSGVAPCFRLRENP